MSAPKTPGPPPLLATLGRVALFLDFDGTLVPIADEPGAIAVPGNLAERLAARDASLDGRLAIVSGRSLSDIATHLGAPPIFRAGSHGSHIAAPDGRELQSAAAIPADVKQSLRQYAARHGLYFEDKPHGAGLHSRKMPDRFDAMAAFGQAVADEAGLACKVGKQVIEIVQPGTGKDGAVRLLMEQAEFRGATPVFLGDDITDEDGFFACEKAGGFGIAVGERPSEGARYRLDGVKEVYEWLQL